MSSIPGPINSSIIQTAQAQQTASKARNSERAREARRIRESDYYIFRVNEVETDRAVRELPRNDSEQAEDEHRRQALPQPTDEEGDDAAPPRIDLQA